MSIATVKPADPMSFEYHENDLDLGEDIDWGTATPISRVNVLDDRKLANIISKCELLEPARIPQQQKALILHDVKTPYVLTRQHAVPEIQNGNELLVRIVSVGLNPIDWKSVDYGFGIPNLPYVAGRDFAGIVVKAPRHSHIREGDTVSQVRSKLSLAQSLIASRLYAGRPTIAMFAKLHTKNTRSQVTIQYADYRNIFQLLMVRLWELLSWLHLSRSGSALA